MSLTVSKSSQEFGAQLKPVDTDLVVVSAIVNALRTLEGSYLPGTGWTSTKDRRERVLNMAADYLGLT